MINILKDALDPHNWIKAFKNPSKFLKIFNDRVDYYPGLRFGYTKSKIIKKFYMTFNIFFARKNMHFKEFFFNVENNKGNIRINTSLSFDLNRNHHINEIHFQCLKQNGVLILENALTEYEQNNISENFNKFKNDLDSNKFDDYKDKELTIFKGPINSSFYTIKSDLISESNLKKINDQITKKIYGQTIKPSQTFGYHKVISLPEDKVYGENVWHSDRYLPNLKLLYFPFGTIDGAPFRYSLGSHKINKEYLNFFLNKRNYLSRGTIENKDEEEKFLKNTKEFHVPPNTLIATFTNGFHGRAHFKKKADRCSLYLMYSNFRLSSLICYWKYK